MKKWKLTNQIVTYIIKQHPLDFCYLSVNDIARHFRISASHLSRIFKIDQGISLREFLFREKINRSKFLLLQNRKITIKELSAALGFCSSNHFIKVFKKHVGVTPGKFRTIDDGIYGTVDRRKGSTDRRIGLIDRRSGIDRRQTIFYLKFDKRGSISDQKDRRLGQRDRRILTLDRRRYYTYLH